MQYDVLAQTVSLQKIHYKVQGANKATMMTQTAQFSEVFNYSFISMCHNLPIPGVNLSRKPYIPEGENLLSYLLCNQFTRSNELKLSTTRNF